MRLTLAVILSVAAAACGAGSNASQANAATGASAASGGSLDACTLLNEDEVSQIVGNAVAKGEHFAGSEVCKWNAEAPNTTVLLTVRPAGSIRERTLCPDLGKSEGQRLDGIADVAIWKFSNTIGLFNSGDLEACGKKGYLSLSLNGRQDQTKLKDATAALARKVLQRL